MKNDTIAGNSASTTGLPATVTVVNSTNGDLNKRIRLCVDGSDTADHPLPMSEGGATWYDACSGEFLATLIKDMGKDQALVLGELKNTVGYTYPVLSKRKAAKHNGPCIVRSKEYFHFNKARQSWVLLDHDTKDMPRSVKAAVTSAGGWQQSALNLWPELASAEAVDTASSSSHINKPDGTPLKENASHKYVLFHQKGLSQKILLDDLLLRGWLHGYSYWVIGKAGQMLERGLFDAAVGSPERLCFEAPPTLEGGLTRYAPDPVVTRGACVGYTVLAEEERAKAAAIKNAAKGELREQAAKVREAWVRERAEVLAADRGITFEQAFATVQGLFLSHGELLGEFVITLSDHSTVTVNDILSEPEKHHMLDGPGILDGVGYGMSRVQIVTMGKNGKPLNRPYVIDYSHGQNKKYWLVRISSRPSVKLERGINFLSGAGGGARAESWHEQQGLLKRRNEHQLHQHQHLWRTTFINFLCNRRNRPRAPQPPMPLFKRP